MIFLHFRLLFFSHRIQDLLKVIRGKIAGIIAAAIAAARKKAN